MGNPRLKRDGGYSRQMIAFSIRLLDEGLLWLVVVVGQDSVGVIISLILVIYTSRYRLVHQVWRHSSSYAALIQEIN